MFTLREHQRQAVEAALAKDEGGTLTAVIPPGGGKTILALAVLDVMRRTGRIDTAMVFTPRLGLCSQFELDWKGVRRYFEPHAMGPVVHLENASVGVQRSFGYVTSYQSLCAEPTVHNRYARRHHGRVALVCDEAHYLGHKLYGSGETTQAAALLAELGKHAALKLVMTGTPYRSDENPIVFARYHDDGRINADVQLTYSDGVAQGFLRPFDATLFDGKLKQTRRRHRDGKTFYATEEVELRFTSQQLTKVAMDPQFWQLAARHAFEKVKELQEMWPRYCGIAGCANQSHAREVMAYLEGLGARCLLAVSDDSDAHANLRTFKNGGWDMLVTVGMAHVGYDHKPISVAAVLNGVREYNWLDQFTMRAGRMAPERPQAEQTAWIVGMNDRSMREYVARKRSEASSAIKTEADEEELPEAGSDWGTGESGPSVIYAGITLDAIEGMGYGYNSYSEELDEEPELLTEREKRQELRRRRQGLVNQFAAQKYTLVNGDTIRQVNSLLLERYGKPVTQCSIDDLGRQIGWLEEKLGLDQVEEEPSSGDAEPPEEEEGESLVQGTLF